MHTCVREREREREERERERERERGEMGHQVQAVLE